MFYSLPELGALIFPEPSKAGCTEGHFIWALFFISALSHSIKRPSPRALVPSPTASLEERNTVLFQEWDLAAMPASGWK